MACIWCRVSMFNRISYHATDCPMVTGVFIAPAGMVCVECDEPMDAYTHVDVGTGKYLCVCLGCAALLAAGV
jgi:hypothetical protein